MEGDDTTTPLPPKPKGAQHDDGLITDHHKDFVVGAGGDGGIATSPSESMSSLDSAHIGDNGGNKPQRRMSNVTDEERNRARVYREGGVNQNGE